MNQSSAFLAIVVPAYRARYLQQALNSLADQTTQTFQVYVLDDASPEDLRGAFNASRLCGRANAEFRRFDENMGRTSLVAHWNRCVQATAGEPWIWLFSDDDIADPHCVESFMHAFEKDAASSQVCRFNTATIDGDGDVTEIHPPHPPSESAIQFAYHRLTFQRRSFAPEYIFQRAAFVANGGFVDFPFALGSDDASWIVFAQQTPIVTLAAGKVYWRLTSENTSWLRGSAAVPKLLALADFSCWMQERFRGKSPADDRLLNGSKIDMEALAKRWFAIITWSLPADVCFHSIPGLATALQHKGFGSRKWWILRLIYVLIGIKARETAHRIERSLQNKQPNEAT